MKSLSNNYIVSLILILPLFTQCQNPKSTLNEPITQYVPNNLKLKKESWGFTSIDTIASKNYSAVDIGNNTYISYFDDFSKKITIISVNECKVINQIDLGKSLTKENFFESFYVHNLDSIFIQEHKNIKLIDKAGNVKFNTFVNQTENRSKMSLSNLGYTFPIIYNSISNELMVGQYCSSCRFYEKKYFQQNIETSLNLSTKQFRETPFSYSQKYKEGYYGFATLIYRTINDSLSVFSFEADANIYLYNRNNGNIEVKGGKSKYDTSIKSLSLDYKNDSNKKISHLTLSPLYFEMYWDPYKKLYYRFFLKEQLERDSKGSYSIWADKPLVLMIFDENFRIVDELDLGTDYNHSSALVTSKGFYIKKSITKNIKKIEFEIFKFEK